MNTLIATRTHLTKRFASAALILATGLGTTAFAAPEPQPAVDDEVIVRGRGYGELRLRIRVAQEAVFARFNDINSTDDFDIHCAMESRAGTRVLQRHCVSNSWREEDSNMAQAALLAMRGQPGIPAAAYRAEQLRMQRLLREEMRRLALEDPGLGEAVLRLGQAMQALQMRTGARPTWTMFRAVAAGGDGLPFDAERMFEVEIGLASWTHYLTQPTFTLGDVSGTVRKLELDCEQGNLEIDYEPEVEWRVPPGWSACMLQVRAKRGTIFRFYEFQ